jgi:hypothetical protein
MPHNRFEYPHFSRQLVAIDPGSYHRLGLAVTDSYVDVNTEIDGRIPGLDKKDKLDKDDLELLNLASSIENISKKICKSANRLAFKKSDYDIKDTISLDLVENVRFFSSSNMIKIISMVKKRLFREKDYFHSKY